MNLDRRQMITALVALSGAFLRVRRASAAPTAIWDAKLASRPWRFGAASSVALEPSGPVRSSAHGQIIENLDIDARRGAGIIVVHGGVTVRNCRIRHALGHGVSAVAARGSRRNRASWSSLAIGLSM